jgi:hypothetical protein
MNDYALSRRLGGEEPEAVGHGNFAVIPNRLAFAKPRFCYRLLSSKPNRNSESTTASGPANSEGTDDRVYEERPNGLSLISSMPRGEYGHDGDDSEWAKCGATPYPYAVEPLT